MEVEQEAADSVRLEQPRGRSKTERVSFRAPKPLVAAAKRETGLRSTTELGLVALATLARPDPVAAAMRRTRGSLGPSHTLDC